MRLAAAWREGCVVVKSKVCVRVPHCKWAVRRREREEGGARCAVCADQLGNTGLAHRDWGRPKEEATGRGENAPGVKLGL